MDQVVSISSTSPYHEVCPSAKRSFSGTREGNALRAVRETSLLPRSAAALPSGMGRAAKEDPEGQTDRPSERLFERREAGRAQKRQEQERVEEEKVGTEATARWSNGLKEASRSERQRRPGETAGKPRGEAKAGELGGREKRGAPTIGRDERGRAHGAPHLHSKGEGSGQSAAGLETLAGRCGSDSRRPKVWLRGGGSGLRC